MTAPVRSPVLGADTSGSTRDRLVAHSEGVDGMDGARAWLLAKPRSSRVSLLALAAAVALGLVAAVALTGLDAWVPIAGGLAGVVLYAIAVLAWDATLSADRQEAINLKARVPLTRRRYVVFVMAAFWIIALLLGGKFLPAALAGTLNVFVLITLTVLVLPSAAERADRAVRDAIDAATSDAGR